MKDYLIPIAIIVGAIIISATTYVAVTDHDRKAYQHCLHMIEEGRWSINEEVKFECTSFVYK